MNNVADFQNFPSRGFAVSGEQKKMNRKEENSHPPAENKGCFNLDVSVNLIPEKCCDPLESGVCRLAAERMTCLHFGTSQEKVWEPNTE